MTNVLVEGKEEVCCMNSIICEPYWQTCLFMCVLVDLREALAVTNQLTDTVYFGLPHRDSNRQPLG
jgi:hypothetical protein